MKTKLILCEILQCVCGISLLHSVWAKWVIIGSVNLKTVCNPSECPGCSAAVFLSISSCFYWLLHQSVCQSKSSCWFTGLCVAREVTIVCQTEQWALEKVNLLEMCISGEWLKATVNSAAFITTLYWSHICIYCVSRLTWYLFIYPAFT